MAPSATREVQNIEDLKSDLKACGFQLTKLKTRYRVAHPNRAVSTHIPLLLSDRNVKPTVARLKREIDFDPEKAARLRREDHDTRLTNSKKVTLPEVTFSGIESAIDKPVTTPAKKATTAAPQTLLDKLYDQAAQIPGTQMRVVWVEVDALMALELLGRNDFWAPPEKRIRESYVRSNRPVKSDTVKRYAKDMLAGLWRKSDLGIAFDSSTERRLLNGQHRLLAVQLAAGVNPDIAIGFPIWFNVDPNARDGYDQGTNRTFSDLADDEPNKFQLGAAVGLVMQFLDGKDWREPISAVARNAWKDDEDNREPIRDAVRIAHTVCGRGGAKLKQPAVAALAYLVMTRMSDRMDGPADLPEDERIRMVTDPLRLFMSGLQKGAGMNDTDPRYAVREWAARYEKDTAKRRNPHQLAILIKAWNRFLTGATMKQPKYEPEREYFPELLAEWTPEYRRRFGKRHKILAD